jgi:hypothetical protein
LKVSLHKFERRVWDHQVHNLAYFYENKDKHVTAAEIETQLKINLNTIRGLIDILESPGLAVDVIIVGDNREDESKKALKHSCCITDHPSSADTFAAGINQ